MRVPGKCEVVYPMHRHRQIRAFGHECSGVRGCEWLRAVESALLVDLNGFGRLYPA
jgi:hypothetical protein